MKVKYPKVFSNRNIIIGITLLFVAWLVFFDDNNFIRLHGIDQKVAELNEQCDYYREAISRDSLVIEGLKDSAFVEKYARDHFYWHAKGERLYIIKGDSQE